jgi:hypothetical protein
VNALEPKGLASVVIAAVGIIACSSIAMAYDSGESCYELKKRYGRCVQASMRGEQCRPEDDFVMPERCRGETSSRQGLRDGLLGDEPTESESYRRYRDY